MNDKPFFHELTDEQVNALLTEKRTWGYVMENFRQPLWCSYPNALNSVMGCWSLVDINGCRKNISHDYCQGCDCYNNKNNIT